MFSAPISRLKTISASSPVSCANSASTFPGWDRRLWSRCHRPSWQVRRFMAPMAWPTTRRNPAKLQKLSANPIATPTRPRRTTRVPGHTMPSPSCQRRSTRPARPIRQKSARPFSPSKNMPVQKANTISTKTATACMVITSCGTRRAPSSTTNISTSTIDRVAGLSRPWRGQQARAAPRVALIVPSSILGCGNSDNQQQSRQSLPPSVFMDLVLQLLFTGIGIGAVYALVALGFVLIFRATNVVNFAQGEFSMVAAYLMVVFAVDLHWPYWLSFLLALAGMALLGAIFNLGVYYPLRHRTFLPVIIATIGASILLANSVLAIYGPQPQVLEGWFETPGIQLGPVYLDSQYLLIIAVTIVLVIFNYWFFEHTMLGKKLQATSQDKEMASLLGISVSSMIMITFIYSAVLGGLAGILVAPILFVSIQMGSTIALKAFAATIIGGFGDVAGAIIGGLALGIIETFGAAYISVPYKDGFAFLVLVLFLVFRPQGIFGERVAEKA